MPKAKPAATGNKRDDPEQSKRFIEAAREAGADETEEGAERAFKAAVKLRKPQKMKTPLNPKGAA